MNKTRNSIEWNHFNDLTLSELMVCTLSAGELMACALSVGDLMVFNIKLLVELSC